GKNSGDPHPFLPQRAQWPLSPADTPVRPVPRGPLGPAGGAGLLADPGTGHLDAYGSGLVAFRPRGDRPQLGRHLWRLCRRPAAVLVRGFRLALGTVAVAPGRGRFLPSVPGGVAQPGAGTAAA